MSQKTKPESNIEKILNACSNDKRGRLGGEGMCLYDLECAILSLSKSQIRGTLNQAMAAVRPLFTCHRRGRSSDTATNFERGPGAGKTAPRGPAVSNYYTLSAYGVERVKELVARDERQTIEGAIEAGKFTNDQLPRRLLDMIDESVKQCIEQRLDHLVSTTLPAMEKAMLERTSSRLVKLVEGDLQALRETADNLADRIPEAMRKFLQDEGSYITSSLNSQADEFRQASGELDKRISLLSVQMMAVLRELDDEGFNRVSAQLAEYEKQQREADWVAAKEHHARRTTEGVRKKSAAKPEEPEFPDFPHFDDEAEFPAEIAAPVEGALSDVLVDASEPDTNTQIVEMGGKRLKGSTDETQTDNHPDPQVHPGEALVYRRVL